MSKLNKTKELPSVMLVSVPPKILQRFKEAVFRKHKKNRMMSPEIVKFMEEYINEA